MKKTKSYVSLFTVFCLLASLLVVPSIVKADPLNEESNANNHHDSTRVENQAGQDLHIEIEAANGQRRLLDYVDSPPGGYFVAVLTDRYGSRTGNDNLYNVAVQVNAQQEVTLVTNKAKQWNESPNIAILQDGFVLLAQDDNYAVGYRQFLQDNFQEGDPVKLLVNGNEVNVDQFKELTEEVARPSYLALDHAAMFSVTQEITRTAISGRLLNYSANSGYSIEVNGEEVVLTGEGGFSKQVDLQPKTNYIDIEVFRNGRLEDTQYVTVYRYMGIHDEHEVWLWIEQSTNAKNYPDKESIRRMLLKAKDAGVTGVQYPAKGHEGFVTYLHNELSHTPHISGIQERSKQGVPEDFDQLQAFIEVARELDLKIAAVFNVYGGGTVSYSIGNPYQLLSSALTPEQLHAYEEWVYSVDDGGEIKRFSDSNYKSKVIHFLNPANGEVQDYQLKHFEEVMRNYDVDAIILDRARYDTMHADFSPESKAQFEQFLSERDKALANWPEDVFEHRYDGQGQFAETVPGPLYYDWLAFRSMVSKKFMQKTRDLVDRVNAEQGTDIPLAISLGSWYENYYQSGQNWVSPNFVYDERLGLPIDELYTNPEYGYQETAFGDPELFDYMVIGTYQNNPAAIKRYLTLLNVLTLEEFPVYAGMQVPNLPEPQDQREAFQAAFRFSNGIKMFDLSRLNWEIQKAAINDYDYVKTYQLGLSIPESMSGFPPQFEPVEDYEKLVERGFIEADFLNQGLAKGSIVVYSDVFGEATGTSGRYTVEAVVDADGGVSRVVNKSQAVQWSWGSSEPANSPIPPGGLVVSTIDRDGTRTLRQLVAHVYNSGDELRAALLRGHHDYDGLVTEDSVIAYEGSVEVIGAGETIEITVNGQQAAVDEYGEFTKEIDLEPGENEVIVEVFVDNLKTNSVTVAVTRVPESGLEAPQNLRAESVTATSVQLAWDGGVGADGRPLSYRLYQDGIQRATVTANVYEVTGLIPETTYQFMVTAVDSAGNESVPSESLTITTSAVSPPGVATLRSQLETYIVSGDVEGPLINQLTNQLNQVEHHLSKGHYSQAVKHLEDFLKHLNNPPMQKHVTSEAKQILEALANLLLEHWAAGHPG